MYAVEVLPDWNIPVRGKRIEQFMAKHGFAGTNTTVPGQTLFAKTDLESDEVILAEMRRQPTGLIMVTSLVFYGSDITTLVVWAQMLKETLLR